MHKVAVPDPVVLINGFAQITQQTTAVPNDQYRDWVIGVVGGLVATAITVFIDKVWKRLIVPWYEERVYQDARIGGVWKAEFHNQGEIEEERIDITTKGHQVSGTITITKGKNEGKVYLFNGNFRNLILVATYHSRKDYELDRGSFALLLRKNGTLLEGQCIYFSDKSNSINNTQYIWQRGK
jgi:hypothetical protein